MSDESQSEEQDYSGSFVCLAPEIGALMGDYLIGELDEVKVAQFRQHLLLCFKCQDLYSGFQAVFESIRTKYAGRGEK